jgi:hypothetical protein
MLDFKHLQLRNEKRYDNVGTSTCSVIVNSYSFTETSCTHIPSAVNRQQLWLGVLCSQHNAYYIAESTDRVVAAKTWIHYSSSARILTQYGVRSLHIKARQTRSTFSSDFKGHAVECLFPTAKLLVPSPNALVIRWSHTTLTFKFMICSNNELKIACHKTVCAFCCTVDIVLITQNT